ncbi:MAG TPA: tetratricopeptide repeat protein [Candidatus Binatia bacterium]|jgi:Flp pilus assembly protein TadD
MKRRFLAALLAVACMTAAGCDSNSAAPRGTEPAKPAAQSSAAPPAQGAASAKAASTSDSTAAAPTKEPASAPAAARPAADVPLKITYPQEATLFPPDGVAPTIVWQDGGADRWTVTIRAGDAPAATASVDASRWRPSEDQWRQIKAKSRDKDAEISVARAGGAPSSVSVHFRTSDDPVKDAIFYREVPLPFLTAVQDPSRIRWRFGTVDNEDSPPIVLSNLPVCGNCHSFADNASALGMDVDYGNDKGAYAIMPVSKNMVMNDEKIITWADYKREDGELTFGLLSRMSPDGRYVISTVKDRSVFVAVPDITFSQLFFPIKGILVVYDRQTKKFAALPGADDPQYVQTNAVWSPDGKTLVFARTKAYHDQKIDQQNAALIDEKDVPEFTRDHQPFRYDLFRIPFNDGKGGKAEPIEGAGSNGKSNYFPKFSPDGKWIVFCKSNSYMLLQPDSELYIIPASGGTPRRLRYNTPLMNSWHSWSSNSRWLVFSSKMNTPYTQLFLTHIDADGNDSPPVLLEHFTSSDRAANIPEFVRLPDDGITQIKEQFLDAYSFLRAGMANEHTGDHTGAERSFRRGLAVNPDNAELHNALGWTLFQEGKTPDAVAEYRKALASDPNHVKALDNLALALVEQEQFDDAAANYRKSLELQPKAEIYSDLGFILYRLGKADEAQADYKKALALDAHCASAHFNLAVASVMSGNYADAESHYREALASKANAETYNGLGFALARQGRMDDAVEQYRKAVEADDKYVPAYNNLGDALARQGQLEEAEAAYRKSVGEKPSAAVYNQLGVVLARLGKKDDATRVFRDALALDGGNADAKKNLASLEQKQ